MGVGEYELFCDSAFSQGLFLAFAAATQRGVALRLSDIFRMAKPLKCGFEKDLNTTSDLG